MLLRLSAAVTSCLNRRQTLPLCFALPGGRRNVATSLPIVRCTIIGLFPAFPQEAAREQCGGARIKGVQAGDFGVRLR